MPRLSKGGHVYRLGYDLDSGGVRIPVGYGNGVFSETSIPALWSIQRVTAAFPRGNPAGL